MLLAIKYLLVIVEIVAADVVTAVDTLAACTVGNVVLVTVLLIHLATKTSREPCSGRCLRLACITEDSVYQLSAPNQIIKHVKKRISQPA